MILRLESAEMAILVGALLTAKSTLTECLVQVPLEYREASLIGIQNVEKLLNKVEGILQDEVGHL